MPLAQPPRLYNPLPRLLLTQLVLLHLSVPEMPTVTMDGALYPSMVMTSRLALSLAQAQALLPAQVWGRLGLALQAQALEDLPRAQDLAHPA